MANAMGDYLENALLNHVLGGTTYTPGPIYAALFTDSCTLAELESGDLGDEIAGTNYSRVEVPFSSWTISNGIATNNTAITFPTATGTWGNIRFMALLNSNGDVLFYGQLGSDVPITDNTFSFNVGALSITIDS